MVSGAQWAWSVTLLRLSLRLTSRQEPDLHQLGLDDDPGQQEAEGGHQVDEGGGGAAVVPRVADQPRGPAANQR